MSEWIADAEEVRRALTAAMRGEGAEGKDAPKVAERLRAAELLGKMYGLFEHRDESAAAQLDRLPLIEAAMEEVMAHQPLGWPESTAADDPAAGYGGQALRPGPPEQRPAQALAAAYDSG